MKNIKRANDIFDLISIATKQCKREHCRVGVVFTDTSYVEKLKLSGIELLLPDLSFSNGVLRTRIKRDTDYSTIDFFAMDIPRMHGKRFDYLLIDSRLTDEEKIVLKCTTFRGCGFFVGDKGKFRTHKDRRKNVVQEFTLAEEWPFLI